MSRLAASTFLLAALAVACGDDGSPGKKASLEPDAGRDTGRTGSGSAGSGGSAANGGGGSTAGQGGSGGTGASGASSANAGSGGAGGSGGASGGNGGGGAGGSGGNGGVGGGPDGGPNDAGGGDAMPPGPCIPAGECDPFGDDPCPGEACRPGFDGTECRALTTPALTEGDPCPVPDENACPPGTGCIDFGDGQRCHRLCRAGSVGTCGETQACSVGALGDACVFVCRPFPARCDVYAQDCADSADTCTLATHPETGERYTGCRPAGPRAEGEPCGGIMGTCGHGLICVGNFCRQVCDSSDGDPGCGATQSCTAMSATYQITYCE